VAAIKTGMLYSAEIIEAVAETIAPVLAKGVPLVIDPVMVASSGKVLLQKEAILALRKFIAQATLVTPNKDEAELLWGRPIRNVEELDFAATQLVKTFTHPHFLVKGGHLKTERAVDVLAFPDGRMHEFGSKRIPNIDPHGTGCTYSAAITAGLAKGLTMKEAVVLGKIFITRALHRINPIARRKGSPRPPGAGRAGLRNYESRCRNPPSPSPGGRRLPSCKRLRYLKTL
jgi:hydroxymethylpyrimidine/phosphomethylpyrimidine kinase